MQSILLQCGTGRIRWSITLLWVVHTGNANCLTKQRCPTHSHFVAVIAANLSLVACFSYSIITHYQAYYVLILAPKLNLKKFKWDLLPITRYARTPPIWCSEPNSATLRKCFTKPCLPTHQGLCERLWVVPTTLSSLAWKVRWPKHECPAEDRQKWMPKLLGSKTDCNVLLFQKYPQTHFCFKAELSLVS